VQVTLVPVSQDALARDGTEKLTGLPVQFPTTIWLVPGASAGGRLSEAVGQVALDPVQTSALSHALPAARQIAPALPGVLTQPLSTLQESTVQGFWSSQLTPEPPAQVPAAHTSLAVQALSSLQVVPSGAAGFEQTPVAGLQVPATWH
jgi:hypothetical protein